MRGKGKYNTPTDSEIDLKALAEILKNGRTDAKLLQKTVANCIGRRRNYIADLEGGRYMPSLATLLKIGKALKLDLNKLKDLVEIDEDELP